ncbi:MAG TPA: hypothetical protein VMD98_09225 [Bryocella sp.]|nr:hypothetical protein [Bryocella sp.]
MKKASLLAAIVLAMALFAGAQESAIGNPIASRPQSGEEDLASDVSTPAQIVTCAFVLNQGGGTLQDLVKFGGPCRVGNIVFGPFTLAGGWAKNKIDPNTVMVTVVEDPKVPKVFGLRLSYTAAFNPALDAPLMGQIMYMVDGTNGKKLDNVGISVQTITNSAVAQTSSAGSPSTVVTSLTLNAGSKNCTVEFMASGTVK